MASVDGCFYSFILHKSSDELFVNHFPFLLVFWLKLQQVFQRSSSNSRHLGNSKNACQFDANPLCVRNVGKKSWAARRSSSERDNMASIFWKAAGEVTFLKSLVPCVNLIPVRYRVRRKMPTRKRINHFVQRRTDLIKKLVLALVQYERIQTTDRKAQQLKKYGDLVKLNIILLLIIIWWYLQFYWQLSCDFYGRGRGCPSVPHPV